MSKETTLRFEGETAFDPNAPKRGPGRPRKVRAEGEEANAADNRKQSLYFPGDIVERAKAEAVRLDRSLSWVFQKAFKIAEAELNALPSAGDDDA